MVGLLEKSNMKKTYSLQACTHCKMNTTITTRRPPYCKHVLIELETSTLVVIEEHAVEPAREANHY